MNLQLIKSLNEAAEKNEIKFEDKEPDKPLPDLIESKINRKIKDGAKDYKVDWKNAVELVNWALSELNIDKPKINTERWEQYKSFVSTSVKELNKARNYLGTNGVL